MADKQTTTAMIAEDWKAAISPLVDRHAPPEPFRWGWLAGHTGEDRERTWGRYRSGAAFPHGGFTHKAWHDGYTAGAARRERGE